MYLYLEVQCQMSKQYIITMKKKDFEKNYADVTI